eukprot:m.296026 g.296026  ORF g.296026 m.296026 type:complete len:67 (+) comp258766_c0_seq1:49-249(+)
MLDESVNFVLHSRHLRWEFALPPSNNNTQTRTDMSDKHILTEGESTYTLALSLDDPFSLSSLSRSV